jgi:hypothetical protein
VGKEVCVLNRENDVAQVEHVSVAVSQYDSLSLDFRFDLPDLSNVDFTDQVPVVLLDDLGRVVGRL